MSKFDQYMKALRANDYAAARAFFKAKRGWAVPAFFFMDSTWDKLVAKGLVRRVGDDYEAVK